jgi:mRNA interferase RelE/StbE
MRYKVFLERKAQKNLESVELSDKDGLKERIIKLKDGFVPELDIKKLRGYPNHYRLRVGRFRVLFKLQEEHIIIVYAILSRKKAYK